MEMLGFLEGFLGFRWKTLVFLRFSYVLGGKPWFSLRFSFIFNGKPRFSLGFLLPGGLGGSRGGRRAKKKKTKRG